MPTMLPAQANLRDQIAKIAAEAKGRVAIACSLPGSRINCDLNPRAHPPMQSVFKLPLVVAVLHSVEKGALQLDQPIRFLASDRILPQAYSPLQDKYPAAEVDVPLRELLRLAVSLSDNAAADILLRIIGGPRAVDDYVRSLGVGGFHLEDNEAAMHRDVSAQYRNWWEPVAAVAGEHRTLVGMDAGFGPVQPHQGRASGRDDGCAQGRNLGHRQWSRARNQRYRANNPAGRAAFGYSNIRDGFDCG